MRLGVPGCLPWRGEIDELRVGRPVTWRLERLCFNYSPTFSAIHRSTSLSAQATILPPSG